MAHFLPAIEIDNISIPGESDFVTRLKNDPTCEDWWILHSYRIPKHIDQIEGEIDFIVFIPNRGVVVVEVKSSPYISVKSGEFYYGINQERRQNPFVQSHKNMYSLKELLEESKDAPTKLFQMVFTHVVIAYKASFNYETEEYESWKLCDKNTYHSKPLSTFLLEAIENQIGKERKKRDFKDNNATNASSIRKCISILRPEFKSYIESSEERSTRINTEISEFTPEQKSVLATAKTQDRLLIKGPAGTGKTTLAMELAFSNAKDNEKVLILCFNRGLNQFLSQKYSKENLTISTFHQLLIDIADIEVPDSLPKTWFDNELLNIASDKIIENDIKFDYLIIDEFQDIVSETNLIILDMLLTGGLKAGKWHFFADFENQVLYHKTSNPEFTLDKFLEQSAFSFYLRVNCRNTYNIVKMIEQHINIEPYYQVIRSDGNVLPARYQYKDDNEQLENIERNLEKLLKVYSKEEIIFLSPKKKGIVESYNAKHPDKKIYEYNFKEIKQSQPGPYFSTIKGFKGLEFNTIIVVDIASEHFLDINDLTNQLYTGLSRGLETTFLHIKEDTEELLSNEY